MLVPKISKPRRPRAPALVAIVDFSGPKFLAAKQQIYILEFD